RAARARGRGGVVRGGRHRDEPGDQHRRERRPRARRAGDRSRHHRGRRRAHDARVDRHRAGRDRCPCARRDDRSLRGGDPMTTPRAGVVLQGAYPPGEFATMVERIEGLGFDNLWLTDSSLHARNAYAYLTLAATRSSTLQLGTAVTNPLTRHPAITATAAATVDEISDGRMI